MGIISTRPTSKKTGMPTRMPRPSSAQGRPRSPHLSTRVLPSAVAPPELASRRPRMAPSPSTMAMWPIRPPTPAVNETGTWDSGMPAAMPSANADTARASAGCRRTLAISTRSSRTVPAAQARRNQLEGRPSRRGNARTDYSIYRAEKEFCRCEVTHTWTQSGCLLP